MRKTTPQEVAASRADFAELAAAVARLRGLCKSFGTVRVLRDVSLSLGAWRVLGLCGENGAGKSTLMRCATGALRPDAGEIRIDAGGEGRIPAYLVPQEFALVPSMTVAENILLGREIVRRGLVDRRAQRAAASGLLAAIGAELDPDAVVGGLGVADRQKVEIARAFLRKSRVIFFDEPTTVLGPEDTAALQTVPCSTSATTAVAVASTTCLASTAYRPLLVANTTPATRPPASTSNCSGWLRKRKTTPASISASSRTRFRRAGGTGRPSGRPTLAGKSLRRIGEPSVEPMESQRHSPVAQRSSPR